MIKFVVDFYGIDGQLDVTQEECAELIQAISKYRRAKGDGYVTTKSVAEAKAMITEEIAHVRGCLDAIQYLLNIPEEDIKKEIKEADIRSIDRLDDMLKNKLLKILS